MRSIWSINDIQKKDKREPLPEHISAAVIGGGWQGSFVHGSLWKAVWIQ